MSDARRTAAKISFDGTDISADISPYFISMTYIDSEEDKADDLQLKLHDRDRIWLQSWLQAVFSSSVSERTSTAVPYKVNAPSGVVMREAPSLTARVLNIYAFGTEISVTDTSGSWFKVDMGGTTGYIFGEYLTAAGASADGVSGYPTLQYGANNDYVKQMQTLLIGKGYPLAKYGADGYFGSETRAAVEAFQKDSGLTVTGTCDEVTWAALAGTSGTGTAAATKKAGFIINASIVRQNWNDGHANELQCGQFELDTVQCQGPPDTVTIKATALPFSKDVRQTKKDRAWEAYTLSGIGNEIAANAGMACMFESKTDIQYQRIEQRQEADIAFLSRLCHDAGLSLKVTNNILVVFDQATYESAEPITTIKKDDGSITKHSLSTSKADVEYQSCRVSYVAPDGTLIEGIAKLSDYDPEAKGNQQLEVKAKVADIAEAQRLAEKTLRLHNKYQKMAQFSMPGNPDLVSGICVQLEGWGPWDGKYIIKEARHQLSRSSGYTTTITLRRVLGGY